MIFLRSNNCLEGYNNRLRIQVKYSNPSIGYLISVLLDEEHHYKSIMLKIIAKTVPKFNSPSLYDNSSVKTPIHLIYEQILSIFTKTEQKRLTTYFDDQEFKDLMELSLQKIKEFEDKIMGALFEEDLMDYEEENKRYI